MMVGTLHTLNGACPICGSNVQRTHSVSAAAAGTRVLHESYACGRCGPTRYW